MRTDEGQISQHFNLHIVSTLGYLEVVNNWMKPWRLWVILAILSGYKRHFKPAGKVEEEERYCSGPVISELGSKTSAGKIKEILVEPKNMFSLVYLLIIFEKFYK